MTLKELKSKATASELTLIKAVETAMIRDELQAKIDAEVDAVKRRLGDWAKAYSADMTPWMVNSLREAIEPGSTPKPA